MNNQEILNGAYGIPYNAQEQINNLRTNPTEALLSLWENLYHQGDVGPASYATTPELVNYGELPLVAAIEIARHSKNNPSMPDGLQKPYFNSLQQVLTSPLPTSEENLKAYFIINASVNNNFRLANAIFLMDIDEILEEYA